MPKPATYLLQWLEENQVYELTRNEHTEIRFLAQNEAPWFHFLETYTSFAFQEREGRLSISKDHAKHLYRKLGVSNRSQASAEARQMKLI